MAVYIIFNNTDMITASPKTFRKTHTAEKHIKVLRDGFRRNQGYYRTNSGERISPDEIQYEVIDRDKLLDKF
jgi:hypothetical protein